MVEKAHMRFWETKAVLVMVYKHTIARARTSSNADYNLGRKHIHNIIQYPYLLGIS